MDELTRALYDWYTELPDPRIKKHGKFESEKLWLLADRLFKEKKHARYNYDDTNLDYSFMQQQRRGPPR